MAVGYKIYLHTNTDQPERRKYKMKSIRKIFSWLGKSYNQYGHKDNNGKKKKNLAVRQYNRELTSGRRHKKSRISKIVMAIRHIYLYILLCVYVYL
jgi:hypothetical protein